MAVGTCNGVAGKTMGEMVGQVGVEGGQCALFGAAYVAEKGGGLDVWGELAADVGQDADWGGDDDEVGLGDEVGADGWGCLVDDAAFEGAFEVGAVGVDADDVADEALVFEVEGE